MKIGIDIDDTCFYTAEAMIKYADIFEEERTGIINKRDTLGLIKNRYYLEAIYNWNREIKFDFFNKYYKNVLEECRMLSNVNIIIDKLKRDGHTVHFVTARLMNIDNCDTRKITLESFKNNNINFDSLDLGVSNKIPFFKENHIDVCIEDSYETCKEAESEGIKSILMTTKMNKNIDSGSIIRVNNWNEVYNKIDLLNKHN